jgi:hypothetical protein
VVSNGREGERNHENDRRVSRPSQQFDKLLRLLLDSRVVEVLRLSHLMLVTLASLQPFFFNGLKKALPFSDNVGAEDPGIQ